MAIPKASGCPLSTLFSGGKPCKAGGLWQGALHSIKEGRTGTPTCARRNDTSFSSPIFFFFLCFLSCLSCILPGCIEDVDVQTALTPTHDPPPRRHVDSWTSGRLLEKLEFQPKRRRPKKIRECDHSIFPRKSYGVVIFFDFFFSSRIPARSLKPKVLRSG